MSGERYRLTWASSLFLKSKLGLSEKTDNFLLRDFITKIQVMFICLPKKEIFTRHTEKNIPMIYRPPYPSYIDPTTHGIWPPINGILTCYPWYIDPLYPWYFDPPTHGILTPLSMVIWPPSQWFIEPPIHGILTPLPISWLEMRGSTYHGWKLTPESKYHTTTILSSFITYHRICNQINTSTTSEKRSNLPFPSSPRFLVGFVLLDL